MMFHGFSWCIFPRLCRVRGLLTVNSFLLAILSILCSTFLVRKTFFLTTHQIKFNGDLTFWLHYIYALRLLLFSENEHIWHVFNRICFSDTCSCKWIIVVESTLRFTDPRVICVLLNNVPSSNIFEGVDAISYQMYAYSKAWTGEILKELNVVIRRKQISNQLWRYSCFPNISKKIHVLIDGLIA